MLDADTKRRIDSCRDMLVGKVPDPKSQVEQITIALIYKFMDDMDAEAEELGGERSFFAGDYAQYGWAKLMSPMLGGFEMLGLYTEGIAKMPQNPGVPALFREIFKNAYLPYRDPETLRAFLREINGFTYDHSERLGDAFEYLLSVLGSQGDAGQFRTPRHIIDFMVDIIAPQKDEKILDPACGTAGFLISSYKSIQRHNTKDRPGDLLTTDDRRKLAQNLIGYDISPDMVRLSLVNLYLHGFADPHIEEYDSLTDDAKWNDQFDVILANPPFMSPKGGIKPHKRFSVQSNRSEVLFVDYIAEHLTAKGRAGIIVPEGVIFQSGGAYKQLREELVKTCLIAVVSLPAGVFQPYSGVKTSILLLDRRLAKKADSVLFLKVSNDGFGLGAQRRAVAHSDLPAAVQHLKAWTASLETDTPFEADALPNAHTVSKAKFAASSDYNLSGGRYIGTEAASSAYPIVKLSELCRIERGGSPRPIQDFITTAEDGINWIKIGDAVSGSKYISSTKEKIIPEGAKKSRAVKKGDFILSNSMSFGRPYIMATDGCIHDGWLLISPNTDLLNQDYLYQILGSNSVYQQFKRSATGGVVNNLNIELVKDVEIPLPPLAVQQEIVAEIEGYQKIIDGARQVVENYKPRIDIRPEWPMVELGEVCESIMDGTHFSPENSTSGQYRYITAKNIKENGLDFSSRTYITKEEHDKIYSRCAVKKGDVLYIKDGATAGIATINTLDEEFSLLSSVAVLRGKPTKLDNRFLNIYLNSRQGKEAMLSLISGVAITRLTLVKIKSATLPLPSIETQRAIVAEIEVEQRLVGASRELMTRFEAKVKAAIDRVWGEG